MPARIGRTDRSTPIEGRVWYAGAWRTPEEVERRRAAVKAQYKPVAVDRRRSSDEEKEAKRVERNERRAARLRDRRANDPEWAERDRARQRGRYVPRFGKPGRKPLDPAERERRAAKKRLEAVERRRAVRRDKDAIRAVERAAATTAPNAVRTAWRGAQPGSIIRRKYPTMESLNASARRGEWDDFQGGR